MAKSRKDQFEEQLRDLQKDISKLSHKLSTPPLNDSRISNSGMIVSKISFFIMITL